MNSTSDSDRVANKMSAAPAVARLWCECYLAGILVGAAFWWWLMPGGFPLGHSRFWLNSVMPLGMVIVAVLALVGMLRRRYRLAGCVLLGAAAAWGAIAVYGRIQFPISLGGKWILGIFASGLAAIGWFTIRRQASVGALGAMAAMIAGAGVGTFVIWAEVPPPPTTRPGGRIGEIADQAGLSPTGESVVRIAEHCQFHPAAENLAISYRGVRIHCSPLMSFDRISPDGFWSLLAPAIGIQRRLQRSSEDAGGFEFKYSDSAKIKFVHRPADGEIELTADSFVTHDTYSHLNSFCTFDISGHRKLSLVFSPCAQTPIDVLPADYPFGRPARFAYVDADERFHVVEATSGEKGPFHELASGTLRRDEPLTITICDQAVPIAVVELEDWSRQLSTALSPTAGWGVPVNSIEFRRADSDEAAPANIWISLAATSVGRGWDCVGHRAGVYRNRMRFRGLGDEANRAEK